MSLRKYNAVNFFVIPVLLFSRSCACNQYQKKAVEAAPIIVEPSGEFLGNDGSWSTFAINVGVPPQRLQVLASTETQETLLVLPAGCNATAGDAPNCTESRGGAYNNTGSSRWVSKNYYGLELEANLGMTTNYDNGQFGYDQLSISTAHQGNVTLSEQILAGIATKDFFLGTLGLSQYPINFTNPFDSRPSLITNLKTQNSIPSLSFGYTAGASYRNNATASLTLGGYDVSRFTPNDMSFSLAKDINRQFVVALDRITFSDSKSTDAPLLTDGILTLIDSTIPTIWLPVSVCQAFERAFGITYQYLPNLYLVNETLHDQLVRQNASVTFTMAQTIGSPNSVNITLPYSSFDLQVDYPLVKTKQRYFPLRRAADDTQYTLGRTLLQESYLIVDYENKNFSISQTTFTNVPAHIVAIQPSNGTADTTSSTGSNGGSTITKTTGHSSHGFPVGAIAGIVVAVILIAFVSGFFTARSHKKKHHPRSKSMTDNAEELPADPRYPHGKAEADGAHFSEHIPDKKPQFVVDEHSVPASPGIEMQASIRYMAQPPELPGSPPFHPARSEAPSPEPFAGWTEMPSHERPAYELGATREGITSEMPSPELRSTGSTPIRNGSPSPDLPSAVSSPGFPWSHPGLGPRRPGQDRVSTISSTDHNSHLRKHSDDSESSITLPRNPSQRADSFETRLEGGATSSTALVGRRPSARSGQSSRLSGIPNPQLGGLSEEGLVEEPEGKQAPPPHPPPQPVEQYGAPKPLR